MTSTTRHPLEGAAPAIGDALRDRSRVLAALLAITLGLGISGQMPAAAAVADAAGPPAELRVGHRVQNIVVPGTELCPDPSEPCLHENRRVTVHVWYPADQSTAADRPKTRYASTLHGDKVPDRWLPLSWTVDADIAHENADIDPDGDAFPVIVFSHGNLNDPIDYAHTLELIASGGFVVAAPNHVNNSQDDVRIDFFNQAAGEQVFSCNDGRPSPCSHLNVPLSMADRVRDIAKVLDELPAWFGDRVNVDRAGVFGHSRGTATGLTAAGGTFSREDDRAEGTLCQTTGDLCWPLAPGHERGLKEEDGKTPRVKAVMGMSIAVQRIARGIDLENVKVPALLVSGSLDRTSEPAVSQFAVDSIRSEKKEHVSITDATHRSFNSTYCRQTQAAGALADKEEEIRAGNGDGYVDEAELEDWSRRAILDWHTVDGTVRRTRRSGKAMEYCSSATFTTPVNITSLVNSFLLPGDPLLLDPDAQNAPSNQSRLETDAIKEIVRDLAVRFFEKALKKEKR